MKKKIAILGALFVLCTCVFFTSYASAQISQGFHDVTILYAGPFFDRIIILVNAVDGSFAYQWLELNGGNDKALLATALTAMSMGNPVRAWVMNDPHTVAGLAVQTCYSILFAP